MTTQETIHDIMHKKLSEFCVIRVSVRGQTPMKYKFIELGTL